MNYPALMKIEKMIYVIRGLRVMMDSDLAELYGVETKRLIEQVKRNKERFPEDFMFECTLVELRDMRSQIATSYDLSAWKDKRAYRPHFFTESGVAMLSSVLSSTEAIQINISIIRTFIKMRSFLAMDTSSTKVDDLENKTNKLFKIVFERMDQIEEQVAPKLTPPRRKIGLKEK